MFLDIDIKLKKMFGRTSINENIHLKNHAGPPGLVRGGAHGEKNPTKNFSLLSFQYSFPSPVLYVVIIQVISLVIPN